MNAHLLPFTDPIATVASPPKLIVSGDGPNVTDADGKTYLDCVSGLWCASLGFNPERLAKAASDQMGKLAFYHSFMGRSCEITQRFAERLVEKLPGDLKHVFFGTSGSEAVENAIKFARYYQNACGLTDKKMVIARDGAYHGSGVMSAALTGMDYCHEGFDLPLDMVLRTGHPHYFGNAEAGETELAFSKRRARELDDQIKRVGADRIAAFIGEPLLGSGGVMLPPEGYWAEIQEVLTKHDILLIADEIITGFGRTGSWFGCETFGIQPDLMTMAKQMTGSVFPMSGVAMTSKVHSVISNFAHDLGTFGHGVTYGGHPVGAAVGLETLNIYDEMDLPTHVGKLGAHLSSLLKPVATLPQVVDVRHIGFLAGVEFASQPGQQPSVAKRVADETERRGVLFRVIDNVIAISPPYIVEQADIDHMIEVLSQSIVAVSKAGSPAIRQTA
jgi:adenosylmethionine-8-amino-7-oxononanoate aminotransferase